MQVPRPGTARTPARHQAQWLLQRMFVGRSTNDQRTLLRHARSPPRLVGESTDQRHRGPPDEVRILQDPRWSSRRLPPNPASSTEGRARNAAIASESEIAPKVAPREG